MYGCTREAAVAEEANRLCREGCRGPYARFRRWKDHTDDDSIDSGNDDSADDEEVPPARPTCVRGLGLAPSVLFFSLSLNFSWTCQISSCFNIICQTLHELCPVYTKFVWFIYFLFEMRTDAWGMQLNASSHIHVRRWTVSPICGTGLKMIWDY